MSFLNNNNSDIRKIAENPENTSVLPSELCRIRLSYSFLKQVEKFQHSHMYLGAIPETSVDTIDGRKVITFEVTGMSTCSKIISTSYRTESDYQIVTIPDYNCTADSYVKIVLYKN